VPVAVELAVGTDGEEEVRVDLPSGRMARLRGFADRVDVDTSGARIVFDYKTGAPTENRLLETDPTAAGTRLQLGIYAHAVDHPDADADPQAYYWNVSARAGSTLAGYEFGPSQRERFAEVVDRVIDGVEAGVFPMNPGEFNAFFGSHDGCRSCPFDRVCPAGRARQFEAKGLGDPVPPPEEGDR
jgi:hypothetical protein